MLIQKYAERGSEQSHHLFKIGLLEILSDN